MLKYIGIVALLFFAVSSLNLSGVTHSDPYDMTVIMPNNIISVDQIKGRVAIKNRRSNAYFDGRRSTGSNVLMTNNNPTIYPQLQWDVAQLPGGVYTFKSVSSGCYLDGRNLHGQPLLVTCRTPDINLYWTIIPTEQPKYFVLKSASSGCLADGRANAGDTAYATCRDWQGDSVFYYEILTI